MSYKESKIWKRLEIICDDYRELGNIVKMCDNAVILSRTVSDVFPDYTLHDETHICNVIYWMEQLLDDSGIGQLTSGECAILLLAACYHDIGMCYTKEAEQKELKSYRFSEYLEENPKAYLAVEKSKETGEAISADIQLDYFRKIHPLRVDELLPEKWESNLVRRDKLVAVCRSHGMAFEAMKEELAYDKFLETDYILCAVLLRLADVMDFDVSRAPHVLYEFRRIDKTGNPKAEMEWKKHQASKGFKFSEIDRTLIYSAVCESMQEEHEIVKFLDYVDEELALCGLQLHKYGHTRWQIMQIPEKAERYIERHGYQSGEYCLTLEADNVLDLLVGDGLYSEDSVFIRELLQNAMDAVRARRAVDYRWNQDEKNQIVLSDWTDQEGYQWFRIDDFGIGMDEQTILHYFLRVGRSYYQSDEFKKLKHNGNGNYDFSPSSQFGIGILSCFLKGDRMEISTRHYSTGKGIRFSMNGTKGYYSLASEAKGDRGIPMPCANADEKETFRQDIGTSIAVRLQEPLEKNMESLIRSYSCFSDIPVCYKRGGDPVTFATKQDLLEFVKKTGEVRIPFSEELLHKIREAIPAIKWEKPPYLCLECTPLDEISESPFISGANFAIYAAGKHNVDQKFEVDGYQIEQKLHTEVIVTRSAVKLRMETQTYCRTDTRSLDLGSVAFRCRNKNNVTMWCADKIDRGKNFQEILAEIPEELLKELPGEDTEFSMLLIYANLQRISAVRRAEGACIEHSIPVSLHNSLEEAMERYLYPGCGSGTGFMERNITEKVYNGICIEKVHGDLYRNSWFRWKQYGFIYTILLLSGEFQPKLGISREKIRYFPVKTAAYIELLGYKIGNSELACYYPAYYGVMEYGRLAEALNEVNIDSLEETVLTIGNDEDLMDIKTMDFSRQNPKYISLMDFREIFDRGEHYFHPYYFLSILQRVLFQKEFEICGKFVDDEKGTDCYIFAKRSVPVSEAEKVFLPLTFVRSFYKNTHILTQAKVGERHALNADHPFSVWLMKYAESFAKKYRSLWKNMRENICKLDAEYMIAEVNFFLEEIRKREPGLFIPDDVWLRESYFF